MGGINEKEKKGKKARCKMVALAYGWKLLHTELNLKVKKYGGFRLSLIMLSSPYGLFIKLIGFNIE